MGGKYSENNTAFNNKWKNNNHSIEDCEKIKVYYSSYMCDNKNITLKLLSIAAS